MRFLLQLMHAGLLELETWNHFIPVASPSPSHMSIYLESFVNPDLEKTDLFPFNGNPALLSALT